MAGSPAALRFSVPYVFRTTSHETDLADVRIGKHEKVLLLLAAADRDETRWECPDQFDSPSASPVISDLAPTSMAASVRRWRASKARPCRRRWPTVWRQLRSWARRSIATSAARVR